VETGAEQVYDVIIIGAGPAGLAAGIYAARDRYTTLLLEKSALPGGQILLTDRIENYPGYESITGRNLIDHMAKQVAAFGGEIATGQAATALHLRPDELLEVTANGDEHAYVTRAAILALGSHYRQLGVPGEAEMRQAGRISYCATCDGPFYRDKEVLVVGGGNTAVQDAAYLAKQFTRKLTIVHRRREFRAEKVLVEELYAAAKEKDVDVKLPYVITEIVGSDDKTKIDRVTIRNVETGETEAVRPDGVFVLVGTVPDSHFLRGAVDMDDAGHIACDPLRLTTSMRGVFVAGDCRQGAPMQLVTACADGALAAMMVKEYFREPSAWSRIAAERGPAEGW